MGKTYLPGKKKKLTIAFDEEARNDYLTGFRKRKAERKAKAQNVIERKLKNQIRQERNKRRKAAQEKVTDILQGITMPGDEDEMEKFSEKVDFGTHEVFVKTDITFGDSGLFMTDKEKTESKSPDKIPASQPVAKRKKDKKMKNMHKKKKKK